MRTIIRAAWAIAATIALPTVCHAQSLCNALWESQFGMIGSSDGVGALASDGAGGFFAAGYTGASLGGPHAGRSDVWLGRFDGAGNRLWLTQFGTSERDLLGGLAPDGSGGVFIAGATAGDLGGASAGDFDSWLARYDGAGNRLWIRQFGTPESEGAWALVEDGAGGVFVGGEERVSVLPDIWLARFDEAGNRLWKAQYGSLGSEAVYSLARDEAGGFFATGLTGGDFGGPSAGGYDAWVGKFHDHGEIVWLRKVATEGWDSAEALAPDAAGGVFVTGYTRGPIAEDAWLSRYDAAGNQLWIKPFGTGNFAWPRAIAPDRFGGAYVLADYDWLAGQVFARFDALGQNLWLADDVGPRRGADLLEMDGGGVLVAGASGSPSSGDAWIGAFKEPGCECGWSTEPGALGVTDGFVWTMQAWNDGAGEKIYAGGLFAAAGGQPASHLARWDPATERWEPVPGLVAPPAAELPVRAMTPFLTPEGEKLIVGGEWESAAGVDGTRCLAAWDGAQWSSVGGGLAGPFDTIWALAAGDLGEGPRLFAAGSFREIGGVPAGRIAAWNGEEWEAIGSGVGPNFGARSLVVFDDGSGPALYIGGDFTYVDDLPIPYLAKWDGSSWSDVGGGLPWIYSFPQVWSLLAVEDAGGRALYVGGYETDPSRWDGRGWTRLGTGTGAWGQSMAVFDDGGGPALFVGGAHGLSKLVEGRFAPHGGGVHEPVPGMLAPYIFSLFPHQRALYLGGAFTQVGNPRVPASGVAIYRAPCTACEADCDGNGTLDVFDFLCFQNLFATGDPAADCDQSGGLDVFDFLCFQDLFAAGCP